MATGFAGAPFGLGLAQEDAGEPDRGSTPDRLAAAVEDDARVQSPATGQLDERGEAVGEIATRSRIGGPAQDGPPASRACRNGDPTGSRSRSAKSTWAAVASRSPEASITTNRSGSDRASSR